MQERKGRGWSDCIQLHAAFNASSDLDWERDRYPFNGDSKKKTPLVVIHLCLVIVEKYNKECLLDAPTSVWRAKRRCPPLCIQCVLCTNPHFICSIASVVWQKQVNDAQLSFFHISHLFRRLNSSCANWWLFPMVGKPVVPSDLSWWD